MALEILLQECCLVGWLRLSVSIQLYQILHPSASTSPSGTGSIRGETYLASLGGVVQCCDLFLSQKLSNFCCRMYWGIVVQEEKITNAVCIFRSSLKICRTTVFGMLSVYAINQGVMFRSSLTILSMAAMLSLVQLVVG